MIGATDTQVVFEAGNTTYVSRRIEAYIPVQAAHPRSCVSVKIDATAFNAACKTCGRYRDANPAVKFEIDVENGQMGLSSISNDQDLAQETIDVEAEGESGTIAFNYHYIFGCLNACPRRRRSRWSSRAIRRLASSSPTTRSITCTWSCRYASSIAHDHVLRDLSVCAIAASTVTPCLERRCDVLQAPTRQERPTSEALQLLTVAPV
ncbi:MAG: hypothetical protein ACLU0O_03435 [Collinsella sp.]